MYGLEAEDGLPPDQIPTQEDVEQAARCVSSAAGFSGPAASAGCNPR